MSVRMATSDRVGVDVDRDGDDGDRRAGHRRQPADDRVGGQVFGDAPTGHQPTGDGAGRLRPVRRPQPALLRVVLLRRAVRVPPVRLSRPLLRRPVEHHVVHAAHDRRRRRSLRLHRPSVPLSAHHEPPRVAHPHRRHLRPRHGTHSSSQTCVVVQSTRLIVAAIESPQ